MNFFCDAHLHLAQCDLTEKPKNFFCTCAHDKQEFYDQKKLLSDFPQAVCAFGIHPQMPLIQNIQFLEQLVAEDQIDAIGEAGFDFYTPQFIAHKEEQIKVFESQLDFAIKYNKPLVIHCRKAIDKLFEYHKKLAGLQTVLFHNFCGNSIQALSFLNHGINGYFSFGKQILNNNKKTIDCVKNLPLENLLFETDAPYCKLKSETQTFPFEIEKVYKAGFELRDEKTQISFEEFCNSIKKNFNSCYRIQ